MQRNTRETLAKRPRGEGDNRNKYKYLKLLEQSWSIV
jgi:hypothetical protein